MGEMYDTIIIGGGMAGLGAALCSGRLQIKAALIGEKIGGTIMLTNEVANYPGFKQITGIGLAERIEKHVRDYNVEIIEKKATKIKKLKKGGFRVFTDGENLLTKTIILATGTEWRRLNVPGEKEFTNKGVHYCALCDGALYKNKIIGIAGGSDSAAKEALLLAEYGKRVYIIYRKERMRAEPINLKRVEQNKRIELINSTNITGIKGKGFVSAAILDKPFKGSKELMLDALFIEIGRTPLSGLAASIGVELNEKKEIIIDGDAKTNVKGVFAAGDVTNNKLKQAITAIAGGVTAAYSVYRDVGGNL